MESESASAKTEAIAGNVMSRNETVVSAIKDTHEKTLEYVRAPVGQTEADINSFFAQVKDDPSIQIVKTHKNGCGRCHEGKNGR